MSICNPIILQLVSDYITTSIINFIPTIVLLFYTYTCIYSDYIPHILLLFYNFITTIGIKIRTVSLRFVSLSIDALYHIRLFVSLIRSIIRLFVFVCIIIRCEYRLFVFVFINLYSIFHLFVFASV